MFGDPKQTQVREPDEGINMYRKLGDLAQYSRHTPLYNSRNPMDTVALLNKLYGYNMLSVSTQRKSISFVKTVPTDLKAINYAMSMATAKAMTESKNNTVRSHQGATTDVSVLYVNKNDHQLLAVECLNIVALSRHKHSMYVVGDDSLEVAQWYARLGMDDEFYANLDQYFIRADDIKLASMQPKYIDGILQTDDNFAGRENIYWQKHNTNNWFRDKNTHKTFFCRAAARESKMVAYLQRVVKNVPDELYRAYKTDLRTKATSGGYMNVSAAKLDEILEHFEINLNGKTVLDICSGPGGMSKLMLEKKVYALYAHYYHLATDGSKLKAGLARDPRYHLINDAETCVGDMTDD